MNRRDAFKSLAACSVGAPAVAALPPSSSVTVWEPPKDGRGSSVVLLLCDWEGNDFVRIELDPETLDEVSP